MLPSSSAQYRLFRGCLFLAGLLVFGPLLSISAGHGCSSVGSRLSDQVSQTPADVAPPSIKAMNGFAPAFERGSLSLTFSGGAYSRFPSTVRSGHPGTLIGGQTLPTASTLVSQHIQLQV
jgi:hypothetical protein